MKRITISETFSPLAMAAHRWSPLPAISSFGEWVQRAISRLITANTLTLTFSVVLLLSVFSGYWFIVSSSFSVSGWDVITQPDAVASAISTAVTAANPADVAAVAFTIDDSVRLALIIVLIAATVALVSAVVTLFHPIFERQLIVLMAGTGVAGLLAGVVYLFNMAAAPALNRHLDYGFWVAIAASLGLILQLFFKRDRLPFRRSYFVFLGLATALNLIIYAVTLITEISRSRLPKQSVAFEITFLIGMAIYGGVMGWFLSGNVFRRKGQNVWLGRALGVLMGAVGNLALLVPLWSHLPASATISTKRIKLDELIWGALFLVPWIVGLIVLTVHPMLDSYRVALYNWQGIGEPTQYVGLRHVQEVIADPFFWQSFRNTVVYTAVMVPIQLSLALGLALILNRPLMRMAVFYRTVYFLPVVTSISVVAVIMRLILGNFGSELSAALGANPPINPLSSPQFALICVIVFGLWQSFGVNLVYFLAALQTVPAELYDAAKVDGANWFQEIQHVTLPGIRPILVVILFLAIIGSMNVFEQSFVLTQGGPYYASQVVNGYIYNYAFRSANSQTVPNLGYASAAALFFSMMMLVLTIGNYVIINRVRKANS